MTTEGGATTPAEWVPFFSLSPEFGALPTAYLSDTDTGWAQVLTPRVGPKEGSCIRPAKFVDGAQAVSLSNVEWMHGALFDVDGDVVPTPEAIFFALEQHRFIWWTTYNHLPDNPRYRIVVPFARPVSPAHFRFFHEQINALMENISAPHQWNLDRLGYFPRVPSADRLAHFRCGVWGQKRLDPYARFGMPTTADTPETLARDWARLNDVDKKALVAVDRTDWLTDEEAFEKARRYFSRVGPGIRPGSRHPELLKIGCKLFFDFWLEWEHVHALLMEINQRFPEPHGLSEIIRHVEMCFARTRGSSAVVQVAEDGTRKEPGCLRKKPPGLSLDELAEVAAVAKKSNDVETRQIGKWLSALLPNEHTLHAEIAPPETRFMATRSCARYLGTRYPTHDASKIAWLFANSLSISNAQHPGAPELQAVFDWVRAAQDEVRAAKERERAEENEARSRRIKVAFGNCRNTEYTQEEIQAFADSARVSLEEWQNRWIIVHGKSHHIFVGGDYKWPVGPENFPNAVEVDLAAVPGLELHKMTKNGDVKIMERVELISRYGTVARKAFMDLSAQRSFFDYTTSEFVEAPCPLRKDLKAEYDPMVAGWLETFPDSHRVKMWLAYLTLLDSDPLQALYLHGPHDSGKSLFAYGINQLYSSRRHITKLDSYFDNFNEHILKSPVLVGDEHLPDALMKRGADRKFRELITSQSRALNRKHLALVSMKGYLRVLLLANNDQMLPRGSGTMTRHDSEAIRDRFLIVNLEHGPMQYLNKLTLADRDSIVTDNRLAKHALWLRDNRPARGEGRFPIEASDGGISTARIDFHGVRGLICQWLYSVVTGQGLMAADEMLPLFYDGVGGVHLGANANIIFKNWTNVIDDQRRPRVEDIADAIRSLSYQGYTRRVRFGSEQNALRWHVVDSEHLGKWADFAASDADLVKEKLVEIAHKRWNAGRGIFQIESDETATASGVMQ